MKTPIEMSPVIARRNDETELPGDEDDVLSLLRPHDVRSLYYLSFLLTADREKAKRCLVTGVEDVHDENMAFREWAHAWARRVIIRNAVSLIMPAKSTGPGGRTIGHSRRQPLPDQGRVSVASILELDDFERFVFVLKTLEGHSPQACSALIACSVEAVSDVPPSTDRTGRGRIGIWLFGNSGTNC